MPGEKPSNRIIYSEEKGAPTTELAAAWKMNGKEMCIVTLNVEEIVRVANGAPTIKALWVTNKPKEERPATNGNQRPAANGNQRTARKRAGPQPV